MLSVSAKFTRERPEAWRFWSRSLHLLFPMEQVARFLPTVDEYPDASNTAVLWSTAQQMDDMRLWSRPLEVSVRAHRKPCDATVVRDTLTATRVPKSTVMNFRRGPILMRVSVMQPWLVSCQRWRDVGSSFFAVFG